MFESDFEQKLYAERQEKLAKIIALGHPAWPNSFPATHTVPQVRSLYDALSTEQLEAERPAVSVAGRLMAHRLQGKAGFAQLQQEGTRIQLYFKKDAIGEQAFEVYRLLDLGDHIGVTGRVMRTRTGELTVAVETLTFLTKAMLALPDKYHGLADLELRYRQRYVDLFMNTGQPAKKEDAAASDATSAVSTPEEAPLDVRSVFVKRAKVIKALRSFFDTRGYIEVETPMMQPIAGGAAARPFETHHNTLDMKLYLRIAPELYLKRLVVGGLDRVYEINRNFRNEGISTQHNPEFTMLEFYQAYANYHDLMALTQELITYVAKEVNGTTKTTFNDVEIDLANWTKLSMREAIIKFWPKEFELKPTMEIFESRASLEKFLKEVEFAEFHMRDGVPFKTNEEGRAFGNAWRATVAELVKRESNYGKAIATLFEGLAEQHLVSPTIIYDFPLAVSPLSKKKPDEPDWVERFEFYIGGFEVGNAFSELNDPADQHRRFEEQVKAKAAGDEEAPPMDEDYVRALAYGLPPTAGEGIGIDRLTMILTGSKSIRDVILFPLLRPRSESSE